MGRYLTEDDLDFRNVNDFMEDFLVITDPLGRGKSTAVAEWLGKKIEKEALIKIVKMQLLLVPYTNLKENLVSLNSSKFVLADKNDFIHPDYSDKRIRVMTIQQFGSWSQEEWMIKLPDIIFFDELHRMFMDSYQMLTQAAFKYLKKEWGEFIAVGLSATPEYLFKYVSHNKYLDFNFVDISKVHEPVIKAKKLRVVLGSDFRKYLKQIEKRVSDNHKIIVYVESKKTVVNTVQKYRERGFKAEGIISRWNNDEEWKQLGNSSEAARQLLIRTGKVDADILIINRSCLEGITIDDPRVKTMFIQAADLITIEQAYGRVRSGLELCMVFVNNADRSRAYEALRECAEFFKTAHLLNQEELKAIYDERENDKDALKTVIYSGREYHINWALPSSVQYKIDTFAQINGKAFQVIINGEISPANAFDYYNALSKYAEGMFMVSWDSECYEEFSLGQAAITWEEVQEEWIDMPMNKELKDELCGILCIMRKKEHGHGNEWVVAKWPTVKKFLENNGCMVKACDRKVEGVRIKGHIILKK